MFPLFLTLLSCVSEKSTIDDAIAKENFCVYRRVDDHYKLNIMRTYIILKKNCSSYELYFEGGDAIIGKYKNSADTLEMHHDFELLYSTSDGTIKVNKIKDDDYHSKYFYPKKFVIRKDSLIDISEYEKDPFLSDFSPKKHEHYILVK